MSAQDQKKEPSACYSDTLQRVSRWAIGFWQHALCWHSA